MLIVAASRLSGAVIAAPVAVCLSVYVHGRGAAGVQEPQEEIGSCELTALLIWLAVCLHGRDPGLAQDKMNERPVEKKWRGQFFTHRYQLIFPQPSNFRKDSKR